MLVRAKGKFVVLHSLTILLIAACAYQPHTNDATNQLAGDTVLLQYAEGFTIVDYPNYRQLVLADPWQADAVLARYYLVKSDEIIIPDDGIKIKIPIEDMAVTAVTQIEFLNQLDGINKIIGVCSPELIYNHTVQTKYQSGEITNLGDAFNINLEKTLLLNPTIVMMSGFKQDDPYAKRVLQAGVSVVYNNEWMESTLLARAEWIKFVGALLDKSTDADSVFNDIAGRYESVKAKAQAVEHKPKVLTGSNFRGTWYMPGGKSFMAQLYQDAGADYPYADNDAKGSLPLNVEAVLKDFAEADVWLNCDFASLSDLVNMDKKHALFKPVQTGRVYNFNKRLLTSGANDYWESAVACPDLLLSDVISVLHPHLLPEHTLIYTEVLKD